jgi:hypothetical protein
MGESPGPVPSVDDIARLRVERDRWRPECERAANERDYLLRLLAELSERLAGALNAKRGVGAS